MDDTVRVDDKLILRVIKQHLGNNFNVNLPEPTASVGRCIVCAGTVFIHTTICELFKRWSFYEWNIPRSTPSVLEIIVSSKSHHWFATGCVYHMHETGRNVQSSKTTVRGYVLHRVFRTWLCSVIIPTDSTHETRWKQNRNNSSIAFCIPLGHCRCNMIRRKLRFTVPLIASRYYLRA